LNKLFKIYNIEEWKKLKEKTFPQRELIIFKHSPRCGASIFIEKLFDKWFSSISIDNNIITAKINVISDRELSRSIALEFSVVHESPQIIWLNNKCEVKWHGSHHQIAAADLSKILFD
jgi:bacillithiol system protein YtxJ